MASFLTEAAGSLAFISGLLPLTGCWPRAPLYLEMHLQTTEHVGTCDPHHSPVGGDGLHVLRVEPDIQKCEETCSTPHHLKKKLLKSRFLLAQSVAGVFLSRFVDRETEAPRAHPRNLPLDSAFSGRYQRMTFYTIATLYCYLSAKIHFFLSRCQKLLSPPKNTTAMHTPKCTFLLKSDLFCGCINYSNGPPPKMNIIIIWGALSTQKHSSQLETV